MSRPYPWAAPPEAVQAHTDLIETERQIEALEQRRHELRRQIEAAERAALAAWAATRPEVRSSPPGRRGWLIRHTDSSVWVWWDGVAILGREGRYLRRPAFGRQGRDLAGSAPDLDLSSLPVLP